MKISKRIFLALLLLFIILSIFVLFNPLRKSEDFIRSKILSEVPIGTEMKEVKKYIEKKKWKISYIDNNKGFLDQRKNSCATGRFIEIDSENYCVVGNQSIRVFAGSYQLIILSTSVTVFFGFDKESKLIDVWVWKTTN